jgi:hypothetical protein
MYKLCGKIAIMIWIRWSLYGADQDDTFRIMGERTSASIHPGTQDPAGRPRRKTKPSRRNFSELRLSSELPD